MQTSTELARPIDRYFASYSDD
ncbi:DUF962 domain-containing protein, partial [Stenotrophomonas maltophilia group sp. RNC7]|nr:DUF962 domain-containing protein [Stenotrophomonas maltophilia group sp. RNC7]